MDLSNLGSPPHKDAGTSPDAAASRAGSGGSGGNGGAQTSRTTGMGGWGGSGGSTVTGGSSYVGGGGSGGARADGAVAAGDAVGNVDGALDGARDVAEDSTPAAFDSGGTDRPVDSVDVDDADDAAATSEAGADWRDLGTDRHETGGKAGDDAGCVGNDCVPFIVPVFPDGLECNLDGSTAELDWLDFSAWEPTYDARLCGTAGAFHVQATVIHFRPGLQVLADVYAAEDSTWHPISGGPTVKPNAAGTFSGDFCMPEKGLERTFRFRIVQSNASQEVGVACLVHVK